MEFAILIAAFLIFGGLLFLGMQLEKLIQEISELRKTIEKNQEK